MGEERDIGEIQGIVFALRKTLGQDRDAPAGRAEAARAPGEGDRGETLEFTSRSGRARLKSAGNQVSARQVSAGNALGGEAIALVVERQKLEVDRLVQDTRKLHGHVERVLGLVEREQALHERTQDLIRPLTEMMLARSRDGTDGFRQADPHQPGPHQPGPHQADADHVDARVREQVEAQLKPALATILQALEHLDRHAGDAVAPAPASASPPGPASAPAGTGNKQGELDVQEDIPEFLKDNVEYDWRQPLGRAINPLRELLQRYRTEK